MAVPSSPRVPYGGPDLPIEELTRLTRAKDAPVLAAIAAGDVEALQVEGAQVRKQLAHQPFKAVFARECDGQLVSLGPT
jgi:hypothetical protein